MWAASSGDSPWRRLSKSKTGDDLGVGLQLAVVAELLHVAAVRVVAGNLAVVHHRPVQQRERMRAAPPAGGVGGEASVGRPGPGVVVADAVERADVLGVAHALEGAHVLARRGDEGPVDLPVDVEDVGHGVLGLVQAAGRQAHGVRGGEVAPDVRRVLNGGDGLGGDALLLLAHEVGVQVGLGLAPGLIGLVHDVEGVQLLVLRVDAVGREAAAQAVGAVVHERDGTQDVAPVVARAASVHDGRDGAPSGNAHVALRGEPAVAGRTSATTSAGGVSRSVGNRTAFSLCIVRNVSSA